MSRTKANGPTHAKHANGTALNGKPRGPARREVPEDETNENIFLFVPNLIGR